jgi:hypothetical protein
VKEQALCPSLRSMVQVYARRLQSGIGNEKVSIKLKHVRCIANKYFNKEKRRGNQNFRFYVPAQ